MATTTSASWQSPDYGFVPQAHQDAELLQQFGYVPGLKEILMLRQVHALEHATVWVLSEWFQAAQPMRRRSLHASARVDLESLSGMSTDRGFYLAGMGDSACLHDAVYTAHQRLIRGEWDLAIHPRCGTNVSVGMGLTVGLALGLHLLLPKGPLEQLMGLGLAMTMATAWAPDLGPVVQRHVTTAIPFNLAIASITRIQVNRPQPLHFVQVQWQG